MWRAGDFARAFARLSPGLEEGFRRWFEAPRPTHAGIVDSIRSLGATDGSSLEDRCPLCRFPGGLDPHLERLPPTAVREIQSDRPSWHPEQGLCPQCADLYLARATALARPPESATASS